MGELVFGRQVNDVLSHGGGFGNVAGQKIGEERLAGIDRIVPIALGGLHKQ